MTLHSKYTDYKIIDKDQQFEKLEHITDRNRTIKIYYYKSGQIKQELCTLHGKLHREDGPAVIEYYESGQIQEEVWYLNSQWHREGGPAYIIYYKSGQIQYETWYLNHKCCRKTGPAIIEYYESGNIIYTRFYLNGTEYTYDDFIKTPEYQAYLKRKSMYIFD